MKIKKLGKPFKKAARVISNPFRSGKKKKESKLCKACRDLLFDD